MAPARVYQYGILPQLVIPVLAKALLVELLLHVNEYLLKSETMPCQIMT